MSEERERAIALLYALGKTTREVVESLKMKGIKGRKASICCCPIANYLAKEGVAVASVCPMEMRVGGDRHGRDGRSAHLRGVRGSGEGIEE